MQSYREKRFLCHDIFVGEIYEWTMKWSNKGLNAFDLIIGCIRNSQKKLLNIASSEHALNFHNRVLLWKYNSNTVPSLILETLE